jgi:hypothetical protein
MARARGSLTDPDIVNASKQTVRSIPVKGRSNYEPGPSSAPGGPSRASAATERERHPGRDFSIVAHCDSERVAAMFIDGGHADKSTA